jgi:hypothetical protein
MGIDDDGPHPGKINDQAVVAQCASGDVVTATANRNLQVIGAGELYGMDYIRCSEAAYDQSGMAVDCSVPDAPRSIIIRVAGLNCSSSKAGKELIEDLGVDRFAISVLKPRLRAILHDFLHRRAPADVQLEPNRRNNPVVQMDRPANAAWSDPARSADPAPFS